MAVATSTALIAAATIGAVASAGSAYYASQQQKKAAKKQERQAQALIAEQKNAEATAKAQATAARRATHANDTKTNYTTALGEASEAANASTKKKTLLGG